MKPTKNIRKFLRELKKLDLPTEKYAVIGGGVLAIRGIRECEDLDLIVSQDFFKELSKKYSVENMTANKKVHLTDDIEAAAFPFGEKMDAEEIIRTADIFAGVRFEDLRETIELKKNGEEKRI